MEEAKVSNAFFGNLEAKEGDANEEIFADVAAISKTTLDRLKKDKIILLPSSYLNYFEKALAKSSSHHKSAIKELVFKNSNEDGRIREFETSVNTGLRNVKNILDDISNLYKNLTIVYQTIEKRTNELNQIDNKLAFSSNSKMFIKELKSLSNQTALQITNIRDTYTKTMQSMSSITKHSIFDSDFNVYNKRYFTTALEANLEMARHFLNPCVVCAFTFTSSLTDRIKDKKTLEVLTRSLSKILLKSTFSDDVVGYVDNTLFATCFKFADIDAATKQVEYIMDVAEQSSIILGDDEINLEICAAMVQLDTNMEADEILASVIALAHAAKSEKVQIKYQDKSSALEDDYGI